MSKAETMADDIEHISNLCQPIINYLRLNRSPYTEVHISIDEIKVTYVELGIPVTKATNPKD